MEEGGAWSPLHGGRRGRARHAPGADRARRRDHPRDRGGRLPAAAEAEAGDADRDRRHESVRSVGRSHTDGRAGHPPADGGADADVDRDVTGIHELQRAAQGLVQRAVNDPPSHDVGRRECHRDHASRSTRPAVSSTATAPRVRPTSRTIPSPSPARHTFKHTYFFTTTGGTGPPVTKEVTITGTP